MMQEIQIRCRRASQLQTKQSPRHTEDEASGPAHSGPGAAHLPQATITSPDLFALDCITRMNTIRTGCWPRPLDAGPALSDWTPTGGVTPSNHQHNDHKTPENEGLKGGRRDGGMEGRKEGREGRETGWRKRGGRGRRAGERGRRAREGIEEERKERKAEGSKEVNKEKRQKGRK